MNLVFLGVATRFALVLLSACLSTWLRRGGDARVLRSLDDAPAGVRIVVLGCPPRLRSGRSNRYFVGRIASAAAAYHHTAGRRILCSGCIDESGVDEVSAMAEAIEAASVPLRAIDFDRGSRRTIESIDHVAERHANEPILLVTQPFHMPRALYLARSRGLDAWVLIASGPTPDVGMRIRESMAELRAVFDLLR